jgi:hypothetical protein
VLGSVTFVTSGLPYGVHDTAEIERILYAFAAEPNGGLNAATVTGFGLAITNTQAPAGTNGDINFTNAGAVGDARCLGVCGRT